jgi:hypothetical protein
MTLRISRLPLSKKDQSIVNKAVKITKFKGFKAGFSRKTVRKIKLD